MYVFGGPLLALVLLVWSLPLKQDTGTSALSSEWKLVTFMIEGNLSLCNRVCFPSPCNRWLSLDRCGVPKITRVN
jgi:hypothetical protein